MPPKAADDTNGRSHDDDDYVAQLLAQDARNSSLKYSALGMQAYMPKRPTTGAPKPNTRFLKNILRSTDSHNTALKRKEEEEARERRRQQRTGQSRNPQLEQDDYHVERQSKRRRLEEKPGRAEEGKKERSRHVREPDEGRLLNREMEKYMQKHKSRRGDEREVNAPGKSSTRPSDRDRRRHHSTRHREEEEVPLDRSSGKDRRRGDSDRHSRHHSSRRRRSYSRSRSRSRSPERSKRRKGIDMNDDDHNRSRHRRRASPSPRSVSQSRDKPRLEHRSEPPSNRPTREHHVEDDIPSSSDSDPLTNLVGPLPPSTSSKASQHDPPVRSRGRGAYKPTTNTIDSHFAEGYDPTLDVQPDEPEDEGPVASTKASRRPVPGLATEDDDWDMALEALRDRALWKQKGADRLREAGFGDDVVDKWSSNGAFTGLGGGDREKGIEDVKWTKKGEDREWDRGKVVDEDGHVDIKAAW